jgi:hypothetical protein
MDRNYHHVTVRFGWQLSKSSLEDQSRNHEQDFDAFAKFVECELQHRAVVDTRTIYGAGSSMREVKFSASIPLSLEEWSKAIASAAKACCIDLRSKHVVVRISGFSVHG